MSMREQAWEAYADILTIGLVDAPHRSLAQFGPLTCIDMGVPHDWGVQSSAGLAQPGPGDVAAARTWMADHGAAHGWRATMPEALVAGSSWRDLAVVDRIAVFATRAATDIELAVPSELTLDDRPSYDDVIAGYGGWMSDRSLAELLVIPTDLARKDRRFIVGTVDGHVVGCAFLWFGGGTGYLSGIGVVPELRGRGYGRALTAAAARLAAQSPDGGGTELVWMHATDEGAALYGQMGFERIDTEISLAASVLEH